MLGKNQPTDFEVFSDVFMILLLFFFFIKAWWQNIGYHLVYAPCIKINKYKYARYLRRNPTLMRGTTRT